MHVVLLDEAGIANGRLNAIQEVVQHPQLAARQRWREIGTSAGRIAASLPPANLEGIEPAMGEVPSLGQHTDAVLHSLGYTPARIEALRACGAI